MILDRNVLDTKDQGVRGTQLPESTFTIDSDIDMCKKELLISLRNYKGRVQQELLLYHKSILHQKEPRNIPKTWNWASSRSRRPRNLVDHSWNSNINTAVENTPKEENVALLVARHAICANVHVNTISQQCVKTWKSEQMELMKLMILVTVNFYMVSVDNSSKPGIEPISRRQLLNFYKDIFKGLGSFPDEYKEGINPSAKPVQHQPRIVW